MPEDSDDREFRNEGIRDIRRCTKGFLSTLLRHDQYIREDEKGTLRNAIAVMDRLGVD